MFFVLLIVLLVMLVGGRIGWLYVRRFVARRCRACLERPLGPRMRAFAERQAAWDFDEAWKRMWTSS